MGGILAAALALGGGIAALVAAQPGAPAARQAHMTARQQTHSHPHKTGVTLTSAPRPWIY